MSLFFVYFPESETGRIELIVPFRAILTNLLQKGLNFGHFHKFENRNESSFFSIVRNFHAVYVSKEWIYFPVLNYFKAFWGKKGVNLYIARFLAIFKNLRLREERTYCSNFGYFSPSFLRPAIFLNLRPERSALFARFYPIATNLSPEIVPREPVVAVKVYTVAQIITIRTFKLRTGIERKIVYFWSDQLEGSWGLLSKMAIQQMNTADLQLRQHTGEPNSPRNRLTKTEAKVVSGWFSGESVIEYLSSNSSIHQKYLTRISFYSFLAAKFTNWNIYDIIAGLSTFSFFVFNDLFNPFQSCQVLCINYSIASFSYWLIRDDGTRFWLVCHHAFVICL